MTIGEKLREWRKAHKLKQAQAAKAAGISQSTWSELELGDFKRINLNVAQRIVAVTGGAVTFADFPRPRGRKVRPIAPPAPDSTTAVTDDSPEPDDESLHAKAG